MFFHVDLIKLNKDISIEELNNYITSDEYEKFMESQPEPEDIEDGEDEEKMELLPEKYFDLSCSQDELEIMIQKSAAKFLFPEEIKSGKIDKYLKSGDIEDLPKQQKEVLESYNITQSYSDSIALPLFFSNSVEKVFEILEFILNDLKSQGVIALDPIRMEAVNTDNIKEVITFFKENASSFYEELMTQMDAEGEGGCGCGCEDDDDEDEDYDDDEDYEDDEFEDDEFEDDDDDEDESGCSGNCHCCGQEHFDDEDEELEEEEPEEDNKKPKK